jgi:hypothetical protein
MKNWISSNNSEAIQGLLFKEVTKSQEFSC